MQRALDHAGVVGRGELRPRQIGLQELVGDDKPAALVAVEQVVSAGEPEVVHYLLALRELRQIDRLARLLLALDLEERECAHRLALAARAQRAERLADLAVLDRAVDRDQHVERMIAERRREGELLLRRRHRVGDARARRTPRPGACASVSIAARRSSSLASTICTSVDQPSDCTPRKPERNAARSLPSMRRRIAVPEHERARHRPFAGLGGALEHERVRRIEPDGAQQLHLRGPPGLGIEPRHPRQRVDERMPHRLGRSHAPHQEVAVLVDASGARRSRA